MKRFLTVLALGAALVLAAASCKKDPETPRIAPQTWLTESLLQEGKYNLHLCFRFDGNGNVGFGYVVDKDYAEYLHQVAAVITDNDLKAQLANAKEGDLVLSNRTCELTENLDGVSGKFVVKKGDTVQATVTYSELTSDSVMMSVLGTASEDTVVKPIVEKFVTPSALGIKIGNIIDITAIS